MGVVTGDAVLIAGFIVTGLEPKRSGYSWIGPSFSARGVADALADTTLEVFRGSTVFAPLNDNWRDNQEPELLATGLQPSHDLEAATVRTFEPGSYTAIVRGNGNTSGVGAVEVYDLTPTSDSRVANISTRGFVDINDNVMIGGFIIGNTGASLESRDAQLLIRALGPSLTAAGVPNALPDPVLSLHNADGTEIQRNDNWRDTQQAELTASGFAPSSDAESALLLSRPSGPSTAIVRDKNDAIGNALVEVYRLR